MRPLCWPTLLHASVVALRLMSNDSWHGAHAVLPRSARSRKGMWARGGSGVLGPGNGPDHSAPDSCSIGEERAAGRAADELREPPKWSRPQLSPRTPPPPFPFSACVYFLLFVYICDNLLYRCALWGTPACHCVLCSIRPRNAVCTRFAVTYVTLSRLGGE